MHLKAWPSLSWGCLDRRINNQSICSCLASGAGVSVLVIIVGPTRAANVGSLGCTAIASGDYSGSGVCSTCRAFRRCRRPACFGRSQKSRSSRRGCLSSLKGSSLPAALLPIANRHVHRQLLANGRRRRRGRSSRCRAGSRFPMWLPFFLALQHVQVLGTVGSIAEMYYILRRAIKVHAVRDVCCGNM